MSLDRPAAAWSESTLDDYLRIENDLAFVEAVCPSTGILAWPAIRQDVLRAILGDRVYPTASLMELGPRPTLSGTFSAALGATAWNAARRSGTADVLLLATGAGLVRAAGGWRNRHVDDFASVLGIRAWTLENSFPGIRMMRARSNRRVGSLLVDRATIALASQIVPRRKERRVITDLLDRVDARGRDLLGWELGAERRAGLIERGASRLAAYPMKARLYARMLRQIRPRLALVEEGCYGHMAVFNAIARDQGIKVGEFQHGMVTRGHDAYNVAPILGGSEAYRRTQPQAFLGYGEWWLEQFCAPVHERIPIGNPHRSSVLLGWSPSSDRGTILVLGDGVETGAHIAFATTVARLAPESRVVFRPHPLEAHRVPAYAASVEVDRESDLYMSFANARAVVAESSTALFEAAGLVPRVFAWDTPKSRLYLGSHPFETARDPVELVGNLAAPGPNDIRAIAALWADDWQGQFRKFLEGELGPDAEPASGATTERG